MTRFTTDNPSGNVEGYRNMVFIKDKEVYLRGMGENNSDINLCDYVRQNDEDYAEYDNETLIEIMCDEITSPIQLLYWLAAGFTEVRWKLQAYEDTGMEPEQVAAKANPSGCEYKIHIPADEGYDVAGRFYECSCGANYIDIEQSQEWQHCPYCGKPISSRETLACITCMSAEWDGDSHYCVAEKGMYCGEEVAHANFDGCKEYSLREDIVCDNKPGIGGIACMPLRRNVPNPKSDDWKLAVCPKCHADCWETATLRELRRNEKDMTALCTECALRAGMGGK